MLLNVCMLGYVGYQIENRFGAKILVWIIALSTGLGSLLSLLYEPMSASVGASASVYALLTLAVGLGIRGKNESDALSEHLGWFLNALPYFGHYAWFYESKCRSRRTLWWFFDWCSLCLVASKAPSICSRMVGFSKHDQWRCAFTCLLKLERGFLGVIDALQRFTGAFNNASKSLEIWLGQHGRSCMAFTNGESSACCRKHYSRHTNIRCATADGSAPSAAGEAFEK